MSSLAAGPIVESRPEKVRRTDWVLVVSVLLLLLVGFMSLYSIDAGEAGSRHFAKQMLRLGIGLVPFLVFFLLGPKLLLRYASPIYYINLVLLALVLVIGSRGGGAQRWISVGPLDFQPSEMAKLFIVVTLAAFFARRWDRIGQFSTFILSLLHIVVPVALIFKQPHLGATLAILVAWLGVAIVAGVPWKFLAGAGATIVALLLLAISIPGVLRDYQLERVMAMFGGDVKGSKFQPFRARLAFASGGLTGVGFLKGEQKQAGFVPAQHTDFIFTVIGEEGGLVGCTLVLGLFGVFFYRVWRIVLDATDPFCRMLAAGIFAVLGFHTIVNIGMNLELLPVVGLWLPFMSYGGTALWLCMGCVGLLLSLRAQSRPVLFS
jgi:rod shape determining protein RodA